MFLYFFGVDTLKIDRQYSVREMLYCTAIPRLELRLAQLPSHLYVQFPELRTLIQMTAVKASRRPPGSNSLLALCLYAGGSSNLLQQRNAASLEENHRSAKLFLGINWWVMFGRSTC